MLILTVHTLTAHSHPCLLRTELKLAWQLNVAALQL